MLAVLSLNRLVCLKISTKTVLDHKLLNNLNDKIGHSQAILAIGILIEDGREYGDAW